jgi:hypothetical protein
MAAKRKHSDPDIVLNSSRNKRVHTMSSTNNQHSNSSILSKRLEDVSTQDTIKDPSNADVKLYMVDGDVRPDTLIPTISQREVTTASTTAVTQDVFRGKTVLSEFNELRKKSIKNKAGDIAATETVKEMGPTPQLKFRPPILDNALSIELHRKVHELRMKEWEDIDVGVEDTFSDARPRHHSCKFMSQKFSKTLQANIPKLASLSMMSVNKSTLSTLGIRFTAMEATSPSRTTLIPTMKSCSCGPVLS